MSAGGLLRNGFKKNQQYTTFNNRCWRIFDSFGDRAIGSQTHQHQHSKAYARFPQSFYRKFKELELSPPVLTSALSSSSSSSAFSGFLGWYLGLINSRPILTKSITSALIYTVADLSSQTISGSSSERYDLVRTARMAAYGMLIIGPSLHFWFNSVSKILPKRDLVTTLKKIVLGQTVYGPIITAVFFSSNAAVQGENGAEIIDRLKRDLLPTLISGVMYWPFCDFLTFKFIPVHLQPLVSNSFSYLWTVYLTYMASLEKVNTE